jgi:chromosome segregation ATPase
MTDKLLDEIRDALGRDEYVGNFKPYARRLMAQAVARIEALQLDCATLKRSLERLERVHHQSDEEAPDSNVHLLSDRRLLMREQKAHAMLRHAMNALQEELKREKEKHHKADAEIMRLEAVVASKENMIQNQRGYLGGRAKEAEEKVEKLQVQFAQQNGELYEAKADHAACKEQLMLAAERHEQMRTMADERDRDFVERQFNARIKIDGARINELTKQRRQLMDHITQMQRTLSQTEEKGVDSESRSQKALRIAHGHLDEIAAALHPHWPEGDRRTYVASELPDMVRGLMVRISDFEAENNNLHAVVATQDHDLAGRRRQADTLHQRLDKIHRENVALVEQLEQSVKDSGAARATQRNAVLEAENEELKSKLGNHELWYKVDREVIEGLKWERDGLKERVAELESNIEDLKCDLAAADDRAGEWE